MFFYLIFQHQALKDDDLIVSQQLVDSINKDPSSTFKAVLYPQFAHLTKKDVQKFLSPVRKPPESHSSARPVGYCETSFHNSDKRMFSGIEKEITQDGNDVSIVYKSRYNQNSVKNFEVPVTVYDNTQYCSSWATAVTSAMSMTLSRWSGESINLSVQFILDCDILGDPCVERPQILAYEQFWRRYIPTRWRSPTDPLTPVSKQLTKAMCDDYRSCYPGEGNCHRRLVLTGVCTETSGTYGVCPIYFLYNWRWIKSHLAEVGAVTSSIVVRAPLFTYADGIYSSWYIRNQNAWDSGVSNTPDPASINIYQDEILGMLDVTIIGWGQKRVNLTSDSSNKQLKQRWWYVIPHLGLNYGLQCQNLMAPISAEPNGDLPDSYKNNDHVNVRYLNPTKSSSQQDANGFVFIFGNKDSANEVSCSTSSYEGKQQRTGIIKFNRRFDDSNIESQAVGAVPWNFIPKPWRTPSATWSQYKNPKDQDKKKKEK